jgi:hypothetical protein
MAAGTTSEHQCHQPQCHTRSDHLTTLQQFANVHGLCLSYLFYTTGGGMHKN